MTPLQNHPKKHDFSHILYGKYLEEAAKDNHSGMYYAIAYALLLANFFSLFLLGLLVPMLTLRNKMLIFKLKFSDDKCVDFNKKDNGGDTGLDNGNRIAGNMYSLNVYIFWNRHFDFTHSTLLIETLILPAKSILIGFPYQISSITIAIIFRIHFSYINTADTNKMANNLGKRWEEMNGTFKQSYMTECHFCDEYLYLPIRANGTAYEFHIFYEGTQHGYRLGFNSWIGESVFCP